MKIELKIDRAVYRVDDNAKTYSFSRRNPEWKNLGAEENLLNKKHIDGYTRFFKDGTRKVFRFHAAKAGKASNKIHNGDLRSIPGVGPRIAEDLISIGVRRVEDLRGKDPEKLYQKLCRRVGKPVDRCVLYVFRCAVYFASNTRHEAHLLKWWNWKDKRNPRGEAKSSG